MPADEASEAPAPSPDLDRSSRPEPLGIPVPCWLIALAALPLHVALALGTDLSPDEAYYLVAARSPGILPRMADHPPLVAWMLRATDLAGPVELRVRCWAIALSLATSLVAVALARARGADARDAQITAWLTSWALLPTAGGFVTTPDTPFLFAFAVALLLAARSKTVASALALGIGLLAKVAALPLALVIGAVDRRLRWPLLVAGLLALPAALPSLRFQLAHAFVDRPAPWSFGGAAAALLAAAAAQAALWTPQALTRGGAALRRGEPLDRWLVIALTGLVALSAAVRATPPEPNWWAPAGLLLAVAAARADWSAGRRSLLIALLAPTAIAAAHTLHPFLPIARSADPTARLHGWRNVATEPVDAAGIGDYGPSAERCIYRNICEQLSK